jgi:tetratricopeptide (TPR) repeat protein
MNKKYVYIVVVLLTVACLVAFGRIAGNHFVNLDDPGYITKNYIIQNGITLQNVKWAFTTTYLAFWHPLTWLSHMLDWTLFGSNAGGHHVMSLLFHIGTVIFLFLFLFKTTNNLWPSAFAAAFFALHPLRVESVAWAAERKDVLSMFFGMASIYAYAFYVESSKLSKYFLCLILFILSLMSKPMLVTLPCILLLLDYWPLGRWQISLNAPAPDRLHTVGKLIWEKIPFMILTVFFSVLAFEAEKKAGAISTTEGLPLAVRGTNAIVSYVAYLQKTFWPFDLTVFYPYDFFIPLWQVIISGIILISITGAVLYSVRTLPFLFTGWFWYLGTLVPVIGLVQVGKHAMADRYTYLPSIGIAIILAWGIPLLLKNKIIRKKVLCPAAFAVLLVLSVLTWNQCGYWKSNVTLFNHAAKVTGKDSEGHPIGAAFTELGQYQYQKEISEYNKAIRMNPDNHLAYFSRAIAFARLGQYHNAIRDYNAVIRLKPDYFEAYNNRGNIYGQHGQYQLAIEDFGKTIEINPNHARAYNNRGLAYSGLGLYDKALGNFNKAIGLQPDYAGAYNNRADAHMKLGNKNSACADAKKACELRNCATLQAARGKGLCP